MKRTMQVGVENMALLLQRRHCKLLVPLLWEGVPSLMLSPPATLLQVMDKSPPSSGTILQLSRVLPRLAAARQARRILQRNSRLR